MRNRAHHILHMFLLLLGAGLSAPVLGDLSEDQAKAGLVYNLTKFVQWPQKPAGGMLNLCVFRDDPVLPILAALGDKTSKGLALRIQRANTTEEAKACQLVFVGSGEQASLRPLARALRGQEILIVSDIPDSATNGAMVAILLEDRHIAFKINKAAADEARLKLSSQLLNLAKAVYEN